MLQSLREEKGGKLPMLLSPRKNGLDSLSKEVRVFKVFEKVSGGSRPLGLLPERHSRVSLGSAKESYTSKRAQEETLGPRVVETFWRPNSRPSPKNLQGKNSYLLLLFPEVRSQRKI